MLQPLERWNLDDILREIRLAEKEGRVANLSYKLLPEFSFFEQEINTSLNFEGSTIQGAVYFHNCKIKGDLIFKNVLIYTTLFVEECIIEGSLIGEGARIREAVNCIANLIERDFNFSRAQIKGLLSMKKTMIKGNLVLDGIMIQNLVSKTGTISGDLYLEQLKVLENVSIKEAFCEGLGDFKNAQIGGNLDLSRSVFNEIVDFTGLIVEGQTITQDFRCQNLIAKLE